METASTPGSGVGVPRSRGRAERIDNALWSLVDAFIPTSDAGDDLDDERRDESFDRVKHVLAR